jgi:GDPmannose 4,6-dehydratase
LGFRSRVQEHPSDYVVATGVGATVRDFCEASFASLGMDYREFVETEERYKRPTEVDALIGDPSKAERVLGWKATTHWRELAEIMVESDHDHFALEKR